jgi:N utilization substance protein A
LQVLVPNALQPAQVEDVILCPMLGRVIVLVQDDQLSLAIGKRGQNVRLASKLVGWDIEVMTRDELDEQLERAVGAFTAIPKMTEELAESLVAQGFLSFDDLSVIEPDQLAEMGELSAEDVDVIIEYAERESERLEVEEKQRRALMKEQAAIERERDALAAQIGVSAPPAEEAPAPVAAEVSDGAAVTQDEAAATESAEAEAGTGEPEVVSEEAEDKTAEA